MRWIWIGALLLWAQPTLAQQRTEAPEERAERQQEERGARSRRARPRAPGEQSVEAGFFFYNGSYVELPYVVSQQDGVVAINNLPLNGDERADFRTEAGEPEPDVVRQIAQRLEGGAAIVVFEQAPLVIFDTSDAVRLLSVVCEPRVENKNFAPLLQVVAPERHDKWQHWLNDYRAPSELLSRATPVVEQFALSHAEGEWAIAANRRLNTWAYPLTVFGMLASVVSFGHLLQFPPQGSYDVVPSRRRRDLCRATVIFLAMVVVLSALDLIWTLLTAQAGQMHELNPIGRELMDNPVMLTAFKMVATVGSCSLLLALRKHPRAQLASWWLCLVCTLLTFRWLVLHSMFVA